MASIPVALQLYSVRKDCESDLPGVLKAVAEMGYDGVEFAGYYGRDASELKGMLDDLGLKVAGTHIGLNTLLGDELAKTVAFNKTLGNRFLIVPGLPEERRNSKDAWRGTADIFNGIAARLKPEGMYTGYHNHAIEFKEMDGELPWDVFFGNTKGEVVMQLDTGNALHGGADPVPHIRKRPGRALTVHIKEFSKSNDKALVGEGDVKWDEIIELCSTVAGTQWYIIEQESYAHPPMKCAEISLQNFRKMLG